MAATLLAQSNKQEMNEWEDSDVARFIEYLNRKYGDKVIDSGTVDKVREASLKGSRLLAIEREALERIIDDKNAFELVWNELQGIQKGEIAVPSTEELNYKVISERTEHLVMMFIAT
eukprot:955881_1